MPPTLQKWYRNINGRLRFTSEPLNLFLDEMKIMESEELHPNSDRIYGFEVYGFTVESDCSKHTTKVLVFLLITLNERWKVLIGYFRALA